MTYKPTDLPGLPDRFDRQIRSDGLRPSNGIPNLNSHDSAVESKLTLFSI